MNTSSNSKKFRIAIVGGGIAGLTCAVALKDCASSNIEINLYEQAAEITEIGAGVTVWPTTWGLLTSVGLARDLQASFKEKHSELSKLAFRFRIGDRKEGFDFHEIYTKGGSLPLHRQELQKALLDHVPDFCHIHLSHRLVDFKENDDSVKLFFKNGVEEEVDILIAADGIKSVARSAIPNKGVFYTGTDAFRGLIPKDAFAKLYPNHRTLDGPIIYCGKNQHIVVYEVSAETLINVVAFTSNLENEGKPIPEPEIRDATKEQVLESFSGWEEEVIQLLSSIENPSRWSIRDLNPMDTYVSRRIALIGDAAHNMTPHLGAGAGQAMDDGYILGKLLSKDIDNWPIALEAYNSVRQPYGNNIQRRAREQGFLYQFNAPGFENITTKGQDLDPEQLSLLRDNLTKNWAWMEDVVEEDLKKAMGLIEEKSKQR